MRFPGAITLSPLIGDTRVNQTTPKVSVHQWFIDVLLPKAYDIVVEYTVCCSRKI